MECHLVSEAIYGQIRVDFNKIHPWLFFHLRDFIEDNHNLRVTRRQERSHRSGFLRLHLKGKIWLCVVAGTVSTFEELEWRPITAFHSHLYKTWLSFAGRILSLLALVIFPGGDATHSTADTQARLFYFRPGSEYPSKLHEIVRKWCPISQITDLYPFEKLFAVFCVDF